MKDTDIIAAFNDHASAIAAQTKAKAEQVCQQQRVDQANKRLADADAHVRACRTRIDEMLVIRAKSAEPATVPVLEAPGGGGFHGVAKIIPPQGGSATAPPQKAAKAKG